MEITRSVQYWAGLIDGEGSFGLKNNGAIKRPFFSLKMAHEPTVMALRSFLGIGAIHIENPATPDHPHYKRTWRVHTTTRKAWEIARIVRPYLIYQAERADTVLSFYGAPTLVPQKQDIEYFAAIIDGEGTFGVWKNGPYHYPVLAIAMCHEQNVRAIQEHFGFGRVFLDKSPSVVGPKKKPKWYFRVENRRAIKILEQVLPFLIAKKEKAEEVLAEVERRQALRPNRYKNYAP